MKHDAPPPAAERILKASVLSARLDRIERVLAGRTRRLVVVLENIEDHHNLSAVIRSAEGFGIQEIHVIETSGPLEVHRKITQGCHKWVELHRHAEPFACVDLLRARGYRLWAAAFEPEARPIHEIDFTHPTALVFGNEKLGISRTLLSRCDGSYVIPMRGFSQSFNISVAAAISLFYATLPGEVRGGGVAPGLAPEDEDQLRRGWLALSVKQSARILRATEPPLPATADEK